MFGLSCLHLYCFPEYLWHKAALCGKNTQLIQILQQNSGAVSRKTAPPGGTNATPLRGTPQSRSTYIFNIKVPDGPVFQRYVRNWCHIDVFKALGAVIPVLLTFDLKQTRGVTDEPLCLQSGCCVWVAAHSSLFVAACQHDQSLHILLPDHSPEIFDCGGQRTLSCNELLPGVVTLPYKTTQTVFPGESHALMWKTTLNFSEWARWEATEQAPVIISTGDEGVTEQALGSVSTHRHVVSIDVVIIWTAVDNWEFHSRRIIWGDKEGWCNENDVTQHGKRWMSKCCCRGAARSSRNSQGSTLL